MNELFYQQVIKEQQRQFAIIADLCKKQIQVTEQLIKVQVLNTTTRPINNYVVASVGGNGNKQTNIVGNDNGINTPSFAHHSTEY